MSAVYPDAPGHRGVDTSMEAADALAPKLGKLQRLALSVISDRGEYGCTADEVAEILDLNYRSTQPRCTELCRKGLVVDSGLRRLTSLGRRAIVWTLPQFRREAA